MSINKWIGIGRLGQDPELRQAGNSQVCNFSIATSEVWTDKAGERQERTTWRRVTVWGRLAESCSKYLRKGSQVYVEGPLEDRKWEDKEGNERTTTECKAFKVDFLDSKQSDGQGGGGGGGYDRAPKHGQYDAGPQGGGAPSYQDDDVPFDEAGRHS